MNMIKAVLLDWDGTLWDLTGFMVDIYTEVFNHAGLRPWTREDFRKKFRLDWRSMLIEMGIAEHKDLLLQTWKKRMAAEKPSVYPWVPDFEKALTARYTLGVVSSAPREYLMEQLERNGILKSVGVVVTGDDTKETKPSPDPLLFAARALGVEPSECVYVGDMVEDIQASRGANMKIVAVPWGLNTRSRLAAEEPDFLAESPDQILDFIIGGKP
jgi:HAD superfamily hydrolase (TIGR01509 family)